MPKFVEVPVAGYKPVGENVLQKREVFIVNIEAIAFYEHGKDGRLRVVMNNGWQFVIDEDDKHVLKPFLATLHNPT